MVQEEGRKGVKRQRTIYEKSETLSLPWNTFWTGLEPTALIHPRTIRAYHYFASSTSSERMHGLEVSFITSTVEHSSDSWAPKATPMGVSSSSKVTCSLARDSLHLVLSRVPLWLAQWVATMGSQVHAVLRKICYARALECVQASSQEQSSFQIVPWSLSSRAAGDSVCFRICVEKGGIAGPDYEKKRSKQRENYEDKKPSQRVCTDVIDGVLLLQLKTRLRHMPPLYLV